MREVHVYDMAGIEKLDPISNTVVISMQELNVGPAPKIREGWLDVLRIDASVEGGAKDIYEFISEYSALKVDFVVHDKTGKVYSSAIALFIQDFYDAKLVKHVTGGADITNYTLYQRLTVLEKQGNARDIKSKLEIAIEFLERQSMLAERDALPCTAKKFLDVVELLTTIKEEKYK